VKAKQLTSTLSFTDHLGRQHSGRKGDYLVESFEGVITITPRQIFEDIYVPMLTHGVSEEHPGFIASEPPSETFTAIHLESSLLPTAIKENFPRRRRTDPPQSRRKSPESIRHSRVSTQLGLM
jgi:hypothetical protein